MSFNLERKLAAIMFTDIAGYTQSMSKSESKTLDLLDKKRSILNPLLKQHKGTFVKEIGDGTLTYFDSAINAASCAVKLQEQTYDDKDMNIRAGIHIGDIVFKDGDVFGDGVNVASRLESIAPKGGVCVSKNVYDELINQDNFDGIELGLQSLKGVGRLVEVFGLKGEKLNEPNPSEYQENKVVKHADDEVPSIAIIPFENKGADEDIFYAYGISADLISDVTSAGLIRVASKKQIDDAGDVPQNELARKLDVRYMANGELWKMGDMFQLSVELYDTKESKLVWSDRWQERWEDLPNIKENLSDGILKTLSSKPEIQKKVATNNSEAYEYLLKANYKWNFKRESKEDESIVIGLLNKALKLDNSLIDANISLSNIFLERGEIKRANEIALMCLKQAENINDMHALGTIFHLLSMINTTKDNFEKSLNFYSKELKVRKKLNDKRGLGMVILGKGTIFHHRGDIDNALDCYNSCLRIQEELDDKRGIALSLVNIGQVYSNKGLYTKALRYHMRCLKIREDLKMSKWIGLSCLLIGETHIHESNFKKAILFLERAYPLLNNISLRHSVALESAVFLQLAYKKLDNKYKVNRVKALLSETIAKKLRINYILNYALYQLLDKTSYIETAYRQIQDTANKLEDDVSTKFLSYPIPEAIVEEYNKIFKNK